MSADSVASIGHLVDRLRADPTEAASSGAPTATERMFGVVVAVVRLALVSSVGS